MYRKFPLLPFLFIGFMLPLTRVQAEFRLPVRHGLFAGQPKKQPVTVTVREERQNGHIYQIFSSRTQPGTEFFRVSIGDYGPPFANAGDYLKLWNYGITDEVDINRDNTPDYAWYGGDDTSQAWYLFLSSATGYRGIDIAATLKAAWERRFHRKTADVDEVGGDYYPARIAFEQSRSGAILDITVIRQSSRSQPQPSWRFRIPEKDFVPYRLPH